MAIHIRPRESQKELMRRRSARMLSIAVSSAVTLILFIGFVLYFLVVYIQSKDVSQFQSIVYQTDDHPVIDEVPKENPFTGGRTSSAASIAPSVDIIVASDSSSLQLDVPVFPSMAVDIGHADIGDIGSGLGPTGLGNGSGGSGTGSGRGHGSGRGGGGKFGKGNNDDIQVVLVLDASGSMDQLFTAAANSLSRLLNMLNSCKLNGRPAKVNLGIVGYGRAKGNGEPWTISNFTTDIKSMNSSLKEVACDGSEECCGAAIRYALKEFPWNKRDKERGGNILKVIFIAGNEPFEQGPVSVHEAIAMAKSMNVIVNTIHCGDGDEGWHAAAIEAGGEFFAINMDTADAEVTPEQTDAALRALYNCEFIPCGSPTEREQAMAEHKKRPRLPGKNQLEQWILKNQKMLLEGSDSDAAEVCRRMGNDFTLAMVGGAGNLPEELRGKGDDELLGHISTAAQKRNECLDNFKKNMMGGSEFCSAALQALRQQAALKGIDIEM